MLITDKNNKLAIDFNIANAPDILLWKDNTGSHAQIGSQVYGDGGTTVKTVWETGSDIGTIQAKEGNNKATKDYALASGYNARATREFAVSMGFETVASGLGANAEGEATEARAEFSHTEGSNCIANYDKVTGANAMYAHVEGNANIANNLGEHAEGNFNISHVGHYGEYPFADNTLSSIGMGTANDRKNAVEVMQNGDVYIIGIGGYDGSNIESAKTVQEVIAELQNNKIEG